MIKPTAPWSSATLPSRHGTNCHSARSQFCLSHRRRFFQRFIVRWQTVVDINQRSGDIAAGTVRVEQWNDFRTKCRLVLGMIGSVIGNRSRRLPLISSTTAGRSQDKAATPDTRLALKEFRNYAFDREHR